MASAIRLHQQLPHSTFNKPTKKRRMLKQSQRAHAAISMGTSRELIRSGAVATVPPKDAASTINDEGFVLLDIRPPWEREKAHVRGSLHVPLFIKEEDNSPITLLKKWVHLGYIGMWTGQYLTAINEDFLSEVEKLVPDKEAKLLVACGEGLRSMMAVTRLHDGGYRNLGWLAGGFNRTGDDDFLAVVGTTKLQYATIGGASYYFRQLLLLLQSVGKGS